MTIYMLVNNDSLYGFLFAASQSDAGSKHIYYNEREFYLF